MKKLFAIVSLILAIFSKGVCGESTYQENFSVPFSQVENLYFDTKTNTFFSLHNAIDNTSVVADNEGRSYRFEVRNQLPLGNAISFRDYSIFLFENRHTHHMVTHFFHLLEHLIGTWGFAGEQNRLDVSRIIFIGDGSTIENTSGPNQINTHLIKALFPNAKIMTWQQVLASSKRGDTLHFEHALCSDRGGSGRSQECSRMNKMLGATRLDIPEGSVDHLAEAVWDYCGAQEIQDGLFHVTYATRPPPRCLNPRLEKKLLRQIENIKGVRLDVIDFADLSFQEQIVMDRKTNLLISVHGMGLSHILYLPHNGAAIEIFPPKSQNLCYRLFSDLRNIHYYGYHQDRGIVENAQAYQEGEHGRINQTIHHLDIDLIISIIKEEMKTQGYGS